MDGIRVGNHGTPRSPRGPGWRLPLLIVGLAVALLLAWRLAAPDTPRVLFDAESHFGRVRVVERADGLRALYIGAGRARQSAVHPGRPDHLESAYTRVATIGLALAPAEARILYVGLGGGAMPMYARHVVPQATIDVVEIDPLIVDVAHEYFGFVSDERMRVHIGDGRVFIQDSAPGAYDLIVLDAFSDDEIPYSLATREFLEEVRAGLAPEGVVVSNLWSTNPLYDRMLATYAAVFPDVRLVRVGRGIQRILVARGRGERLDAEVLVRAARQLGQRSDLGFDLGTLVREGYTGRPSSTAPALHDR